MKIRTAFVANSSSSSYVVAFPKKEFTYECDCGVKVVASDFLAFFHHMIETDLTGEPEVHGDSLEDVLKKLDEMRGWNDDPNWQEQVAGAVTRVVELSKDGNTGFAYLSIPYGAEAIQEARESGGVETLIYCG